MEYKEHLLYYFLQGKVSLSQYDQKFMSNLQMIAHRDNRITSNQVSLFDKLVGKYSRQLQKSGLDVSAVSQLPWKTEIVSSSEKFTSARVSLENEKLVLRVPFNKKFIADFRNIKLNPFQWVRESKYYTSNADTNALKIVYTTLGNYFPAVQYCSELQTILSSLDKYTAKIWEPTLVKVNGRLVILAVNDILGELIKDIELKEDAKTFFLLSQYGIKVDESLAIDKKLKFASESITTIDMVDFSDVLEWMHELGISKIYLGKGLDYKTNRSSQVKIVEMIEQHRLEIKRNFNVLNIPNEPEVSPILLQYLPTLDTMRYHTDKKISKCVIIKDSRPIEVK